MAYTQIRLRHDPASLWAAANPVLAAGEPGIETDTRKMKIGDGATRWNDLGYTTGSGAGAAWGDIAGTIASNAALVAALDGKQDLSEKGQANGYAGLGADGKVPAIHLPTTATEGCEKTAQKGIAGGYAPLDGNGAVPEANLPTVFEKNGNKGKAGGYAGLGSDAKLLDVNLPASLERTTNRGKPGGYAPLGSDGKVPEACLPPMEGSGSGTVVESIPRGVILMWSGALADIPKGWALCDGTQGTPNLLDRFALCVPNATTNPGASGGTNEQRITEAQMPTHKHTAQASDHTHTLQSHQHSISAHRHNISLTSGSAMISITLDHAHSFSSGLFAPASVYRGGITHNLRFADGTTERNIYVPFPPDAADITYINGTATTSRSFSNSHTHTVSGNTGDAGNGSTGASTVQMEPAQVPVTISEAGSNGAFDNRPAFYTLAFIMKL